MFAEELRRDIRRKLYVRSRTARSAALRIAYLAYARTLNGFAPRRSSPEAAASLRRRMEELFEQDFRDAEAGYYPPTLIEALPWREYALAAPKLIADLPRTRSRIRAHRHDDLSDAARERYPLYYARNFHYQTVGYLGHTSAELYDLQVELLFGGTADAMRRRLIPPIVRFAGGAPVKVLDVACGTGHFLRMLGAAMPKALLFGLDLSPQYVARARETLPRELDVSLVVENAERMPFVDGHFDVATSVFLFHELPPEVRARVLSEMARVVRPGGLVVVADSLQLRDTPELSREIEAFPERFHEPYYRSYVEEDLAARVAEAGLRVRETMLAFLTKVVVAEKPAAA
jgi:ubiquinone/menaquinone biosynthesis C-methylase UbiE